jgi:hypothetical protein
MKIILKKRIRLYSWLFIETYHKKMSKQKIIYYKSSKYGAHFSMKIHLYEVQIIFFGLKFGEYSNVEHVFDFVNNHRFWSNHQYLRTKKPLIPVWTKNLIERTTSFGYIKNFKELTFIKGGYLISLKKTKILGNCG